TMPPTPVATDEEPKITERRAKSDRCPAPDTTAELAKKSEPVPPASNKTLPNPFAATATPSANADPSVSAKFPANVRNTIEPSPPVVLTSDCAASVTEVAEPSAVPRRTVTFTVPTVNASDSKI